MDLQLRNKVALISGGSKGIGFSTARAFAKEGCNLAICSRNEAEVREAKEELEEFGVRVIAGQADVCQPESTETFVEQSVNYESPPVRFLRSVSLMIRKPLIKP